MTGVELCMFRVMRDANPCILPKGHHERYHRMWDGDRLVTFHETWSAVEESASFVEDDTRHRRRAD